MTRFRGTFRFILVGVLVALAGCSDDPAQTGDDAGMAANGDSGLDSGTDARRDSGVDRVDSGDERDDGGASADAADGASADAGDCVGACQQVDLQADFGGTIVSFERAYYGLTSPDVSGDDWEIYVEVYAGGTDGCPSQDSPTPDQTLIVSGVPLPTSQGNPTSIDEDGGLVVTLFDFEGSLTQEPLARAAGESAEMVQASVCTDCAGDDPDGWVAFDLNAPFTDGGIDGHVYATHCSSLDSR